MAERDMRARALAIAAWGLPVFRLKPNGKTPAVKRFYDVASCDPETVHKMWTGKNGESLNWNIGVSTDDLCVIDVDNKNNKPGNASLAKLVAEDGLNLDTPTVITPGGGRHLYYRLPPGEQIRNTFDELGPGIDTRGWHGYVVGAGSVVPDGEYYWEPRGQVH